MNEGANPFLIQILQITYVNVFFPLFSLPFNAKQGNYEYNLFSQNVVNYG